MLQETFLTSELEILFRSECGDLSFFNHGTNHSKGVVIIIKIKNDIEILDSFMKFEGRAIVVRFKYKQKIYFIVNVYAPTVKSEKELFYKTMFNWIKGKKHKDDLLILGGDWNCVQDPKLDTRGWSQVYKPIKWLENIQNKFNLIDVWRKMYPLGKQFTWRKLSLGIYSRLDYWLISSSLYCTVQTTDIRPAIKCDHCAVSLRLRTEGDKKGKGLWKFNNSLLCDIDFKNKVKGVIQNAASSYNQMNARTKWDMCKIKVREFAMKFSKERNRKNSKLYKTMYDEYTEVCRKVDNSRTKKDIERMMELKKEIEKWHTHLCKGAFIRSRERWMEQGEKSTKYFLNLEKRNGKRKELDCISKNGKIITGNENILKEITKYYRELYSKHSFSKVSDIKTYLETTDLTILSEEDALLCEGLVTEKECCDALNSMRNNKSPGSDGLTAEFYKCFWDDLKFLFMNSLNESFEKQELSESQKQAVITLLHKKGDKRLIDNWRPISLLNIDYKILAKTLCKRLHKVLENIISADQTGYLKQRSAVQNIRLVLDVIDYCNYANDPGIFIFLDFKKAFDNINHDFLFFLLYRLMFKGSFKHWVKTLYNNVIGRVINNGWISQDFKIEQGVRQGCPLSALLFILVAEVISVKVKQNPNIKGIQIRLNNPPVNEENIKISQLADDTIIFVNSIESGNIAIKEVKTFGVLAGPKLNLMKTSVMSTGNQEECLKNLEWTNEPIKYLGVYITKDRKESECLNWNLKLEKAKSLLRV